MTYFIENVNIFKYEKGSISPGKGAGIGPDILDQESMQGQTGS